MGALLYLLANRSLPGYFIDEFECLYWHSLIVGRDDQKLTENS